MKRIAATGIVVLALSLPAAAQAKDMSGRFGIGADTSLGFFETTSHGGVGPEGATFSYPGLSIVYQTSKVFGIQAILAFDRISGSQMGMDFSQTDMVLAGRGIYQVLDTSNTAVGLIGGLSLNRQAFSVGDADDSVTHVAIELGVRPEYFVSQFFSIHTQVGVAISILDEDNSGFSEGGVNVNIFGAADLLGSAGFTFYF